MAQDGFRKLYWGFLFTMIDFRFNGIDILPDIIGYILFAIGFGMLAASSVHFNTASKFNIPMIILSIFHIYERPVQGGGINVSPFNPLGMLLFIASLVLGLLTVYYLFMGVKEMAQQAERDDIFEEAGKRWDQFLLLNIAGLFMFIFIMIPPLAIIYILGILVAAIVLVVKILRLMKNCEVSL